MSRLFNGSTGLMTYASAGTPAMNDALSLLMVVKIAAGEGDNTWMSFMEFNTATANACGMVRKPDGATGELAFINTTGTSDGTVALDDSDGWMVLAITRSTAAVTTLYKIPIGGATVTSAGGALADGLTWQSTPTLTIGGPEDPANFYWAAGAYWDGVTLSQAQIEGIATAKTTASIDALNPTWLADDSDAFATNLTNPGVGDRTSEAGTADDADDPSGWVYGLGGGAFSLDSQPAAYTFTGAVADLERGAVNAPEKLRTNRSNLVLR